MVATSESASTRLVATRIRAEALATPPTCHNSGTSTMCPSQPRPRVKSPQRSPEEPAIGRGQVRDWFQQVEVHSLVAGGQIQSGGVEAVGRVADSPAAAEPHLQLRLPNCRSAHGDAQVQRLTAALKRESTLTRRGSMVTVPDACPAGCAVEIDELTGFSRSARGRGCRQSSASPRSPTPPAGQTLM